jgi:predicted ATPase/class 3 adenylate cyclase/DNA-binding CsgD family transcriptional regulator
MAHYRQLSAIMFTDIVGYSRMMQENEEKAHQVRKKHRYVFARTTGKHDGKILQYYGDGTLSIFNSTLQAVRCAVELQQELRSTPVVPLRIGIHSGDILYNDEEVIGDGINIAARIESLAVEGSVLVSEKVYDDIKNHQDIGTVYLGTFALKNVGSPVGLYAIRAKGLTVPEHLAERQSRMILHASNRGEHPAKIIGRARETDEILALFRNLDAGHPGSLIITGEAGVGKTTLLQHVLRQYHGTVVEIRCHEGQSLAYGPYVQALRYLLKMDPDHFKESVQLYDHLSLILPEIRPVRGEANAKCLQDAIAEFLQVAAKMQPVVLVIEDLQWADKATINMLPRLFEPPGPGIMPLLAIGTIRTEHLRTDHWLRSTRNNLRRLPGFKEIELRLLDQQETKALLQSVLGKSPDTDLCDSIFEKSRGLPLFVEELAKALQQKGCLREMADTISIEKGTEIPIPDTIRDTVALQLDGLSEDARMLLDYAATIGLEFEIEVLGALTKNDAAIDELLQRQLIFEQTNGRGVFRHNLILESIRQDILWSKRRILNSEIAAALERRGAPSHIVGEYWAKGGEKQKAIDAFVLAADYYCNIHAHHDAAALAGKAIKLWPAGMDETRRLRVLKQYAQCTRINGHIGESIRALTEILQSGATQENSRLTAETSRMIASCYAMNGHWQEYKKHRATAAALYEGEQEWLEAAKDWHELSNRHIDELRIGDAIATGKRAMINAEKSGNPATIIKALSSQGYALSMAGKKNEALNIARRAFEQTKNADDVEATIYAYRKLAGVFEYASEFTESIKTFDTALHFCQREDMNLQAMLCMSCMSWVMFRLGDWNQAIEVCRKVIEDAEVNTSSKSTAYGVMALIHTFRGTLKTAGRYHKEAWHRAHSVESQMLLNIGRWGVAVYQEYLGKNDKAFVQYNTMLEEWQKTEDKHDILAALSSASSFYASQGHKVEAIKCVDHCARIAEETGNPEAIGMLSFCLGVSTYLLEQYDASVTHLQNALQYFKKLNIPLQVVHAEYQLGKAYSELGNTGEAVRHWKSAVTLCNNMGMRPLASKLKTALTDAGEIAGEHRSAKHAERQERGGLTDRQFEILRYIAGGLSNKEIAGRLHLSTRTVDMHVRNLFDALNCRNRAEAVKAATDQGIIS